MASDIEHFRTQDNLSTWVDQLGTDEYAANPWDEASTQAAIEALLNGEVVQAPVVE